MVQKPISETLTQAAIRLRELKSVMIDRIMKVGITSRFYVKKLCQLYLNVL